MSTVRSIDSIIQSMNSREEIPFVLRDAHPDDLDTLFRIDRICFPLSIAYSKMELRFYLRNRDAIRKVACARRGGIAGFALGRVEEGVYGHIITLDVLPEHRRRKIGSALLRSLHDELAARRCVLCYLEVHTENLPALQFYEAFGYTRVETLQGYYGKEGNACRMVRFFERRE